VSLSPSMNEGESEVPDPKVWFQISRGHRHVARLPEGKTGVEALIASYSERSGRGTREDYERWARRGGEGSAGDSYLRTYASRDGLGRQLTRVAFEAFRAAGGDTYQAAHYKALRAKLDTLETLDREQAGAAILEWVDTAFANERQPDSYELQQVLKLLAKRRRDVSPPELHQGDRVEVRTSALSESEQDALVCLGSTLRAWEPATVEDAFTASDGVRKAVLAFGPPEDGTRFAIIHSLAWCAQNVMSTR
jgi:hypothetical protein